MKGALCISLDFEKFWGVHDVANLNDVEHKLLKVDYVVNRLLDLFEKYNIHCTWATVGLLGFDSFETLNEFCLDKRISYLNENYSPFPIKKLIDSSINNKIITAKSCIDKIKKSRNQEIASHTFSHFYTLEQGQTKEEFIDDLNSFKTIVGDVKSIIFPRNQINETYLQLCAEHHIISYRGNQNNIFWSNLSFSNEKLIHKIGRTIDAYIKISKDNLIDWNDLKKESNGLINIPASRFLKSYKHSKFIENLKLKRLKKQMLKSAQKNKVYHLWWHPHNFTTNTDANFKQLESLFVYYKQLEKDYGYQSLNMKEIANQIE